MKNNSMIIRSEDGIYYDLSKYSQFYFSISAWGLLAKRFEIKLRCKISDSFEEYILKNFKCEYEILNIEDRKIFRDINFDISSLDKFSYRKTEEWVKKISLIEKSVFELKDKRIRDALFHPVTKVKNELEFILDKELAYEKRQEFLDILCPEEIKIKFQEEESLLLAKAKEDLAKLEKKLGSKVAHSF